MGKKTFNFTIFFCVRLLLWNFSLQLFNQFKVIENKLSFKYNIMNIYCQTQMIEKLILENMFPIVTNNNWSFIEYLRYQGKLTGVRIKNKVIRMKE